MHCVFADIPLSSVMFIICHRATSQTDTTPPSIIGHKNAVVKAQTINFFNRPNVTKAFIGWMCFQFNIWMPEISKYTVWPFLQSTPWIWKERHVFNNMTDSCGLLIYHTNQHTLHYFIFVPLCWVFILVS